MEWIIMGLLVFIVAVILILKSDWQNEKDKILKSQEHISR